MREEAPVGAGGSRGAGHSALLTATARTRLLPRLFVTRCHRRPAPGPQWVQATRMLISSHVPVPQEPRGPLPCWALHPCRTQRPPDPREPSWQAVTGRLAIEAGGCMNDMHDY